MKTRDRLVFLWILLAIIFLRGTMYACNGEETLVLNKNWQFSQYGSQEWMEAMVPGTVHQDLIAHGKLPDPFYGLNEQKIQWVENEDWLYRTVFQVNAEQLKHDEAVLVFEGLDTYADVYLNGALILRADNMFVGYQVPVKPILQVGDNRLVIRFRSPVRETLPQWESNGFNYPADNDHLSKKLSVFSRKAPYSYGWDWGIRMVTSGIWRPAYLKFQSEAVINDFYVNQQQVSADSASICNQLEITSLKLVSRSAELVVSYEYQGKKEEIRQDVVLNPGKNNFSLPLLISQPHLWMPNGWGEPALYTFTASIYLDKQQIACQSHRIGLRSVRVVKEKDADGMSFYFVVNGIPLFAKGANLIPSDALLPRVTVARYARLMEDAQRANMNLLRVWGGGIYEDDRFYEEADRRGILIWQDFMFSCTTYPHDPAFLESVVKEAEYNIKRLRNHASLAMWCGNNEIYEGIRYWGWHKRYTPAIYQQMKEGYEVLFRKLLPELVQKWDSGRFYLEGSPYEANWGRPESWKIADSHNWGIWHGRKPFECLDVEIPRFMSEFGFQAFPEMKTLRTFASSEDFALESSVMNAHQKSNIGNALIKETMARYYNVPESFEDLVYVGLVLQGRGVRHGVEAHRRHRPYCMGSLPWQLNDSWPVVSWSAIDYFGNWKALQYQLQRAFSPVLVNAVKEGDKLRYYILSDVLEAQQVVLRLELIDFNGKIHRRREVPCIVPANSSVMCEEEDWKQAFEGCDLSSSYLRMKVIRKKDKQVLSDEVYYPVYPKDQLLPQTNIDYHLKYRKDGSVRVTLKARQLARAVFVEVPLQGARFTDNFFDLLPGEKKEIVITSADGSPITHIDISIKHLGIIQ